MTRLTIRLFTAVALLGAGVSAGTLSADASSSGPVNWSPGTSFVGLVGADQYGDGRFVRYDYAFDDRGAATHPPADDYENAIFPGDTAARSTRGSYRYPDANNVADIVKVSVTLDEIEVALNALKPGSTVVGVAIDTDMDLDTGRGEWPFDARLTTPGADVVLTGYSGAVGTSYNADRNTITLDLPPSVPKVRWRMWVGAGLWDGEAWMEVPTGNIGNSPGTGSAGTFPKVFDLAFNRNEPYEGFQAYWNEQTQAESLGAGDVQEHAATVDFGLIRRRAERHPAPPSGAYSSFVYRSSIRMGEGLVPEPRRAHDNFVYLSRWQPFTVYVPKTLRTPAPLMWLLHFRGGNQNGFPVIDDRFTRIGERLGALIVMPNSRGEYRLCEADGEVDFFDTNRAVHKAFTIDDDRVYLTGLSMGGMCTWRLGLMYPDLFAAAITVAGSPRIGPYPSGTGLPVPYDMTMFAVNARYLPYLVIHGMEDEILPWTDTKPAVDRLSALGYEHRVQLYPSRQHDSRLTAETYQSQIDWLQGRARVESPPRVTYRTWPKVVANVDPAMLNRNYGFKYDDAYWVRNIRPRDRDRPSFVDARTPRSRLPRSNELSGTGSDDAGPYVVMGQKYRSSISRANGGRIVVFTRNVRALTLRLRSAGVAPDEPLVIKVKKRVRVKLIGRWRRLPNVFPRAAAVSIGSVILRGPGRFVIRPW